MEEISREFFDSDENYEKFLKMLEEIKDRIKQKSNELINKRTNLSKFNEGIHQYFLWVRETYGDPEYYENNPDLSMDYFTPETLNDEMINEFRKIPEVILLKMGYPKNSGVYLVLNNSYLFTKMFAN